MFQKCYTPTQDTKLRWFQLRILHRIIPTQKYLFTCKRAGSSRCTFCYNEPQTIQHLFWHCPFVQSFWTSLLHLLHQKCQHTARFAFKEDLVLFGISENVQTDKVLDFIILHAKYFVYKCKLQNTLPCCQSFMGSLKYAYNVEKFAALRTMKMRMLINVMSRCTMLLTKGIFYFIRYIINTMDNAVFLKCFESQVQSSRVLSSRVFRNYL